ncbi:hypothetical protein H4J02_06595 [Protaetiibacter sp. SSC-01]|uniref:hypothetical protein n=1 Tax=Protaetiibacter sp. SSC-01 TaxID=2759943 RepID=UPI0016571CD3|nr:hypothetical protein [Protaetiibacter sp. SSC-01]QNO38654.1 hypothetical protein H4J02_06595 [Protaetiibacter sp. SSC-01]
MADTKQTKTIGEHHVASELARRGWAPALTRDGLERTDILAVLAEGDHRRPVEIQVKAARGPKVERISWPLGPKSQGPSRGPHEFFVMVAIPDDLSLPPRDFVVPRIHVAAAAWIEHMDWLTKPGIPAGQRNAPVERARVWMMTLKDYEGRWDLLLDGQDKAPVLLPKHYRDLATDPRVGLPPEHEWREALPSW